MIGRRLARRVDAAQGRIPCDVLIRNVRILDVFRAEWVPGEVGIVDGVIVGTEPGLQAKRVMEGKGGFLVPGFIDAHVHLESSMMVPRAFEEAVLPLGTTSAICDPHEIANVLGVPGIEYFLNEAELLAMDLRVMLPSCVPATHLETNGAGILSARELFPLAGRVKALGLAEMMNVPGVLGNDPLCLDKLEIFQGRPLDGHAPLVSGQALSAYAATGVSSCHESSEKGEALEKLRKGMAVWIREGSVAKDLAELAPILTLETSTSIGFCTDDRNPVDVEEEGHIDHLIRGAIRGGVPPIVAFRAASWSVARHYGIDRGFDRVGAVAPGYRADLVLLADERACGITAVFKSGVLTSEIERGKRTHADLGNTVRISIPEEADFRGPEGRVHVIEVIAGKIITGRSIRDSKDPGVARLSVLERHGKGSPPANAYVSGFGERLCGAIASSVGHDSHNLIAVGTDPRDLRVAMASLAECGGGFAVARGGVVIERLPLPFAGLMSTEGTSKIDQGLRKLREAARSVGCALPDPFLQLAFLSLPVIPSLKLTDKGLVDVEQFKIISVSV